MHVQKSNTKSNKIFLFAIEKNLDALMHFRIRTKRYFAS